MRAGTHTSRPGAPQVPRPTPIAGIPPAGGESDTGSGSPAGGGVFTADDLARFATALMERRLLGPELMHPAITGYVATAYGGKRAPRTLNVRMASAMSATPLSSRYDSSVGSLV
jgi:hypothetical protein